MGWDDDWGACPLIYPPSAPHLFVYTYRPVETRQAGVAQLRGLHFVLVGTQTTMSVCVLVFVLFLGCSRASDTPAPAQLGPTSLGYSSSVRSVCKPIPSTLSLCHGIGYRHMRVPNLLGHDSLREAQQQSASWLPLVSKLCHRDTKKFLCSLFAPVCLPELSGPVSPCRSLCEAVRDHCVPVMSAFGFPWPEMFNCTRFPRGTELCIPLTGEQEGRTAEEVVHEETMKGQWTTVLLIKSNYIQRWMMPVKKSPVPPSYNLRLLIATLPVLVSLPAPMISKESIAVLILPTRILIGHPLSDYNFSLKTCY